jgi:RNA polymerase sigma-B factor
LSHGNYCWSWLKEERVVASVEVARRQRGGTADATKRQETGELAKLFASTEPGDPRRAELRDQTIEAWLPLARHLARRYAGRGEAIEDLIQVAVIGLIKAVDRYQADRGVEFAGYAIPTIVGEIKRHFRDHTWAVHVPRRLQELRQEITTANDGLTHTLGRPPTVTDIAEHLKIRDDDVLEGLEGARAYATASLCAPVGDEGGTELGDTIGDEDPGFELAEFRTALGPALTVLNNRERTILALRFYDNLSQTQIAEQIGISQMHVSRTLNKALTKLRREFLHDTPTAH